MNSNININIPQTTTKYQVEISDKPFSQLFQDISDFIEDKKALIVVSKKVHKLYHDEIRIKNSVIFVLNDGEKEKNFQNYNKIIKIAQKNNLERNDYIIAIGGGVVGDLAGFAASTYMRGINFIQIPTTLLADVDASIGGKTAINTDYGKNTIGSFYHPKKVFCNINFLKTLDDRQFKTGLAEILKYAFIEESCLCDENFNLYELLLANKDAILNRQPEILSQIIKIAVELKKSVITKDEKDSNIRNILNFGHTYGHAYEVLTGYKKLTHGEAVAAGMIKAFEIAKKFKLADEHFIHRSIYFIESFEIIKKIPKFSANLLAKTIKQDKKMQAGKIKFILPTCNKNVKTIELELDNI